VASNIRRTMPLHRKKPRYSSVALGRTRRRLRPRFSRCTDGDLKGVASKIQRIMPLHRKKPRYSSVALRRTRRRLRPRFRRCTDGDLRSQPKKVLEIHRRISALFRHIAVTPMPRGAHSFLLPNHGSTQTLAEIEQIWHILHQIMDPVSPYWNLYVNGYQWIVPAAYQRGGHCDHN